MDDAFHELFAFRFLRMRVRCDHVLVEQPRYFQAHVVVIGGPLLSVVFAAR